MCRFGNKTSLAHFLTPGAILCFSPPIYGKSYRNTAKEKSFPFFVSNNAVDFSFGGRFTYSSTIPMGKYQAGTEGNETLLNCPRGAYCNEYMENNFTLCAPGTYQPLAAQRFCISCPIGYICSEFGMVSVRFIVLLFFTFIKKSIALIVRQLNIFPQSVPRICPAGYGEIESLRYNTVAVSSRSVISSFQQVKELILGNLTIFPQYVTRKAWIRLSRAHLDFCVAKEPRRYQLHALAVTSCPPLTSKMIRPFQVSTLVLIILRTILDFKHPIFLQKFGLNDICCLLIQTRVFIQFEENFAWMIHVSSSKTLIILKLLINRLIIHQQGLPCEGQQFVQAECIAIQELLRIPRHFLALHLQLPVSMVCTA